MNVTDPATIFAVSFAGSFFGTLVFFIAQYWLYKKQNKEQETRFERFKKSVQRTIRGLKKK